MVFAKACASQTRKAGGMGVQDRERGGGRGKQRSDGKSRSTTHRCADFTLQITGSHRRNLHREKGHHPVCILEREEHLGGTPSIQTKDGKLFKRMVAAVTEIWESFRRCAWWSSWIICTLGWEDEVRTPASAMAVSLISFNPTSPFELGTNIPVFQMRTLWPREDKWLARGHTKRTIEAESLSFSKAQDLAATLHGLWP